MKVPFRNSLKACWISSRVFITKGPYGTIGSPNGEPAINMNLTDES